MDRSLFRAEFRGELEPSGNGHDLNLVGHAVVFNRPSELLRTAYGAFREWILPGALDEVLASGPDVRLLVDHSGVPLGRTKPGTLDLTIDEAGLRVWSRIHPSRTDIISALERGDVDQMSFAFSGDPQDIDDEWRETDDPNIFERTISRIGQLFDVSLVSYPAYPDTDAALRDLRSAAEAGKIVLPDHVARAETDPAGDSHHGDSTEDAPEVPAVEEESPLAAFKTRSTETVQRERESYLRLLKELSR